MNRKIWLSITSTRRTRKSCLSWSRMQECRSWKSHANAACQELPYIRESSNICAFISISLSEADKYNVVIAHLKKIPEVVECHFVTGKYALLVKIYCFDNDHLMEILLNTIQKIPYILSTETMIALDEAIDRQVWVKDYSNTSYSGSNKNDDSDE